MHSTYSLPSMLRPSNFHTAWKVCSMTFKIYLVQTKYTYFFRRVSFAWHTTMKGDYSILLLLSCAVTFQSQSVLTTNKSFSFCNPPGDLPACAYDTPDRRVTPNPGFNPGICSEVLCAWECRKDLQCLEFNVHINRTCDLYYNQPMNYQSTTDCRHFQVSEARILRINLFHNL